MDVERADVGRPDEAFLVVVRLGDDGHDAGHADAVRPHGDGHQLAVLVLNLEPEGLSEETAELEDVPDFHAPRNLDRARTIRRRVSRTDLGNLGVLIPAEVATGDQAEHVVPSLVCTRDPA